MASPFALPSLLRAAPALLAALALALPAAAQDAGGGAPAGAPAGYQGGGNLSSIPDPGTVFGGGGPGAFLGLALARDNGDLYLKTVVNTDFNLGPVGLGLALPLSVLVINNEDTGCPSPKCSRDSKAFGGFVRRHDWDEPGDYLRFIRYVRYGHKRDPFYALVGQHWGSSVGHGTLVNRYNNTLNLDQNKVGVALDLNFTFAGVETLVDNVMDPNLLAGRVYVRPFGDTPILRGWAVGATVASDLSAPRNLATVPAQGGGTQLAVDDKGRPIASFSDNQLAGGIDTEYELLNNSLIRLIPFIDANRIAGAGNGLHLGVMGNINLPIPILEVTLDARLEYRFMQAGYIPEYFDQQYDLGRVNYARQTASGTVFVPKATAARQLKADPATGTQGYYGELAFNFAGFIQVGGTLQDYQGDNGASLGLYLTVPKIEFIKIQGYYLRKNFSGLGEAFKLDNRSLLGGSLAYKVFGPMYLRAQFERSWVVNPGSTTVSATDNFGFGVAMFLPFGGSPGSAGPPPAP